jgi:hypothetical protein
MAVAETNQPAGHRYRIEVGARLRSEGLDAIDKGARSRLIEVMRHRDEIVVWHAALPLAKRLKLNHPEPVLSAWKRTVRPPAKKEVAVPKGMSTGSVEAIGRYIEGLDLGGDQVRALFSHAPGFRATVEKCIRAIWVRQEKTKKKNARLAKKTKRAVKAKNENATAPAPAVAGNDVSTEASAIARKALNEMRSEAVH